MRRPTWIASGVATLVALGFVLGVRPDNLHNGLLALSFVAVGDFVLRRRPRQREAQLFLAAGSAEAVIFLGRQVGADGDPPVPHWLAEWGTWLAVWPLPLVLVLVGATVMCFPDGGFPSRRWRIAFWVTVVVASVLALMSALWPVDYVRTDLVVDHPFSLPGQDTASDLFATARPVCFTSFQVLWLACVVARFAGSGRDERRQLRWLVAAMALSVVVLGVGLVVEGSPRAGLLTVPLLPIAAGIAIVEASYEALVREVRSSAQRVVTAQDEARRRLERDLHDGAQHRLVVLGMELGRVVDSAERTGDPDLVAKAVSARQQLLEATAELRELARGIHPSVLTQDGLDSALGSLADRSPIPVRLEVDVRERCGPESEATAYFVVSEGLTNAARHSGASLVNVRVVREGPALHLEISDDGSGGAVSDSGLQGLADRVASLGGRLTLSSPVGGGTRLLAELPC